MKGVLTLADKANQTLVMQAGLVLLSSMESDSGQYSGLFLWSGL